MEHALTRTNNVKDCLIAGLLALALVACLPLVGAFAFALRPVLFIAALAAIPTGCVLWTSSTRFRAWLGEKAEVEVNHRGLRLIPDISVHPGHAWVRFYDQTVVGADDLMQAALGPIDEVELPPDGLRIQRGQPLFRLRRGCRSIEVMSPVSGTIIATNKTLLHNPELVNREPFGGGWIVRLRCDDLQNDRRRLLHGGKARTWFRREVDRFFDNLAASAGPLHQRIDDAAWRLLTETTFAAGSDAAPR
jgi:glycine cleavage system H protein